ncbi:MAG: AbrB/MazE/SpoVT family DNA-binding domain-containing protein [Ruminococcaceae bacterium]|nr:AbrB/MazE/SpoVT family DNA-binding domain-containing protein [Oscillospiraceae bacterium]
MVIPKEIRRTMRIREGDPLEIYTEKDGEVIFKKYSPVGELADFALHIVESLNKTTGCCVAVCDRDMVISVSGVPKRELCDKPISMELEKIMEDRQIYQRGKSDKKIALSEANEKYACAIAAPIIAEGDVMGCVVFFNDSDHILGEVEYKLAQTVSGFLGKQMES